LNPHSAPVRRRSDQGQNAPAPRLFAGPPDTIDPKDPLGSFEGRAGALLWSVSTADGARKAQYRLDAPPAFDGLIAAGGKLYMTTIDGAVSCWAD